MGVFGSVIVQCPKCGSTHDVQSNAGDSVSTYRLDEAPLAILEDIDGTIIECDRDECGIVFRVQVVVAWAATVYR